MSHSGNVNYRPAREADIAALMQFVPVTLQGSWSVDTFRQLLRAHKLRVMDAGSGEIIGFAEFSVVLDESELMSLAVRPGFQRQGLGKLMLNLVLKEIGALGVVKVMLEVRSSNEAARHLYETRGFTQDGIRRGYYSAAAAGAPREDACLYSLELESSSRD